MNLLRHLNPFREPDLIIRRKSGKAYLRRWWVIPRNKHFNIYLHHFLESDDPDALHDHPWNWASVILKGQYWEHTEHGLFLRRAFRPRFGEATDMHRVELTTELVVKPTSQPGEYETVLEEKPVWTIFITGPKKRDWGFKCPSGWRLWSDYVSRKERADGTGENGVGAGCGE